MECSKSTVAALTNLLASCKQQILGMMFNAINNYFQWPLSIPIT